MSIAREGAPVADCHVHLFDPARFPYNAKAAYRPAPHETATFEQLLAVLESHGVSHALLVTPTSGYGNDNGAAADAIARRPGRLKGVAVVDPEISEEELLALKAKGFVGVRLDLAGGGAELAGGLLAILKRNALVLEIQVRARSLNAETVLHLRRDAGPIVIDHMGLPDPSAGRDEPGFAALLELAQRDEVFVKLSGPFRFSQQSFPHADADAFAEAVISAFGPERCVWGSDWPFVHMGHRVDYGPCREALDRWLPNREAQRQVLWETPRRVFGFEALS